MAAKPIYKMVKSEGKEVGIAEGYDFETLEDAIATLQPETCRDLVNTQDLTNRMNKIRSKYNAKPSKEEGYKKAMAAFGELPPDQMSAAASAPGGLQVWLEAKVKEFEASSDANKEQMIADCAKRKAELAAAGKEIIGAD